MKTKTKTGKLAILFIVSIMALASANVSYALWSETLYIDGTVVTTELDWEYWNYYDPSAYPTFTHDDHGIDPDMTKDVASTTGEFFDTDGDGDYDQMVVTIDNAYPGYHNHIGFWVHCNGNLPLIIWKVIISGGIESYEFTSLPSDVDLDLDNDGNDDISIYWGNNFGVQLHNCESADMSFGFVILQPTPQGETLTFTIEIVAVQYNEYPPT